MLRGSVRRLPGISPNSFLPRLELMAPKAGHRLCRSAVARLYVGCPQFRMRQSKWSAIHFGVDVLDGQALVNKETDAVQVPPTVHIQLGPEGIALCGGVVGNDVLASGKGRSCQQQDGEL